jgi:hypothetical protein
VNLTQWLMIAIPLLVAYLFFVLRAESNGRINCATNALGGLFFVPVFLGLLPLILLGAHLGAWRKRDWASVIGTLLFILALGGYGAAIHHLRDRPPLSPHDLPVER